MFLLFYSLHISLPIGFFRSGEVSRGKQGLKCHKSNPGADFPRRFYPVRGTTLVEREFKYLPRGLQLARCPERGRGWAAFQAKKPSPGPWEGRHWSLMRGPHCVLNT